MNALYRLLPIQLLLPQGNIRDQRRRFPSALPFLGQRLRGLGAEGNRNSSSWVQHRGASGTSQIPGLIPSLTSHPSTGNLLLCPPHLFAFFQEKGHKIRIFPGISSSPPQTLIFPADLQDKLCFQQLPTLRTKPGIWEANPSSSGSFQL